MNGMISNLTLPSNTHVYYALSRALLRGTSSRPPLSIELVQEIFNHAGVLKEKPTSSLTTRSEVSVIVGSYGTHVERIFFQTKPTNVAFITNVKQMRLHTSSHDQGWVSDPSAGNWTWFEIGILRTQEPDDIPTPVLRPGTLDPLRWESHRNVLSSATYQELDGAMFEADHEIWAYLRGGDSIAVYACAVYPMWVNNAESGYLEFWERFDPMGLEQTEADGRTLMS